MPSNSCDTETWHEVDSDSCAYDTIQYTYIRYCVCVAAIIGHFDEDEKEQRWGEKVSKMYNSHAAEVWRMHIFNMLLFSNCCKLHFDTVLAKYVNFKMQNIRPVWKYIRSWWQEAASLTKSTSGKTWVAKTVNLYLMHLSFIQNVPYGQESAKRSHNVIMSSIHLVLFLSLNQKLHCDEQTY